MLLLLLLEKLIGSNHFLSINICLRFQLLSFLSICLHFGFEFFLLFIKTLNLLFKALAV